MLKLLINEIDIPLSKEAEIGVTWNNPIFDTDGIERVWSYPFQLPLSDELREVIDFKDRLDAGYSENELSTQLLIGGQLFTEGVIALNDEHSKSDADSLDVHFKNRERSILNSMAHVKIGTLLGVIDVPQPRMGYWAIHPEPPTAGRPYFLNINDTPFNYTALGSDTSYSVAQYFANAIQVALDLPCTAVPAPPIRIEIRSYGKSVKIGQQLESMTLLPNSITYPEARQRNFLDFVEESYVTPRLDLAFPFFQNPLFYGTRNIAFTGYFNQVALNIAETSATALVVEPKDTETFERSYSPFIRMRWVLQKIQEYWQLAGTTGDFEEWQDVADLLIETNWALDDVVKMWIGESEKYCNQFFPKIELSEIFQDMTVKDFLSNFAASINLKWRITDSNIVFSKKRQPLQSTIQDVRHLSINGFQRVYKKATGFTLRVKADVSEKYTAPDLAAMVQGEGLYVLELQFGTMAEKLYGIGVTSGYTEQEGSTLAFGIGKKQRTLRLVHEKKEVGLDAIYKTCGFSAQNQKTFDLSVQGNNGLYNTFFKGWIEIVANSGTVTKKMDLDIVALMALKGFKNPVCQVADEKGDFEGVVKSVEFSVSTNELKVAKVVFYFMPVYF